MECGKEPANWEFRVFPCTSTRLVVYTVHFKIGYVLDHNSQAVTIDRVHHCHGYSAHLKNKNREGASFTFVMVCHT